MKPLNEYLNGSLVINTANPIDTGYWQIIATMKDATGTFFPINITDGNVIYSRSTITMTGMSSISRYIITEIDPLTDYSTLYATIKWGEDWSDIMTMCDPNLYDEAIIGELVDINFPISYISSQINDIGEPFVHAARNMDLSYAIQNRNISSGTNTIERKDVFVVVDDNIKEYTLTHSDIISVDHVLMNGLELSNDPNDDYIVNNGKIQLNNGVLLTPTDVIVAKYKTQI